MKFISTLVFTFLILITIQAQVKTADDLLGPMPGCRAGQVIDMSDDGKTIVLGAPQCLTAGIQAGQILVYRENNGQWEQYGSTIDGEAATDFFGGGVAISGDGNRMAAAATLGEYLIIYELIDGELQEITRLEALQVSSKFGEGLSFSRDGKILVIGSSWYDLEGNDDRGFVQVFRETGGNWEEMYVNIPDLADHYAMGKTVEITGDGHRIVVGGLQYFYILQLNEDDQWVRVGERISGDENWDRLGAEVAISEDGKTIIAGGWLWGGVQGDAIGMARVYKESNGQWEQFGQSIIGDSIGEQLGYSVDIALNGKFIAIGSKDYQKDTIREVGRVQMFNYFEGEWVKLNETIYGDEANDRAGYEIAMTNDGTRLAIGAPWNAYGEEGLGKISFYGNLNLLTQTNNELIDEKQVMVYPNPSGGRFEFSLGDHYKKSLNYSVFDALGRPIINNKKVLGPRTECFIKNAGIYFLTIIDGSNSFKVRIMVAD